MLLRPLLLAFCACLLFVAPARAAQTTCVWIGDSLDAAVDGGVYAEGAVHIIERDYDVRIVNLSSPGAALGDIAFGFNSNWTTHTFDRVAGYFNALDCIVIAAGTNDARSTASAVQTSLNRILDYARSKRKRVLMLDLVWNNERDRSSEVVRPLGLTWSDFRRLRRQLCLRQHGDTCTFLPRPAGFNRWDETLFGDNVHLNAAGQRARAAWIGQGGATARFWRAH